MKPKLPSRKTVILLGIGGFLLVLLLVVLYQLRVTLDLQTTDRFTRAVEQLGHEQPDLRLGGIYALERIARDSLQDHAAIMDIFTLYVRRHASWKESRGASAPERPPVDLQAVLTVLGRRNQTYQDGETKRLDLRRTDLRLLNLNGAHLEGAILSEAHLEGASLAGVHLELAILRGAVLQRALLTGGHLNGAFLAGAHLEGAILKDADLEEAHFTGAFLEGADLRGTNLRGAYGLTWEQVQTARRDHMTRFPDYLTPAAPDVATTP